jgi:hypothetical protein
MIYYNSKVELVRQLYDKSLDILIQRGIYPFSGSGKDFIDLLDYRVQEAISNGELPQQNQEFLQLTAFAPSIQAWEDSLLALVNQMAEDAVQANETELHEYSLGRAIRKLCPLYPFLREPCANYSYLMGYNDSN